MYKLYFVYGGCMRNYRRHYNDARTNKSDKCNNSEGRTKLVVDENSIYEIDLDCYECNEKEKKMK